MPPWSLIDTHTHFDVEDFDHDRSQLAEEASAQGVEALILIGYVARYFERLTTIHHQLNAQSHSPVSLLAPGLHPFYIQQHQNADLIQLDQLLRAETCIAVGEIGLDTFTAEMKLPAVYERQKNFFSQQLEIAKAHDLPVLLHIRRAHADSLAILKQHRFKRGGIAHAFGGGIEEAKAFIKLGFKLGINGLVTDPNAKRLRTVVQAVGAEHLVLETDCPDMTPICCRVAGEAHTRNTPVNLPAVLDELVQLLGIEKKALAQILWHNTQQCLGLNWEYGHKTRH
ncbi:TatD family hydrolase [Aquirhabdus parva]|uniref:TatD family deoxyribonuclease n=1 Tax=Aquirhabdus parva TaxID=2283318 RepID=A0A345P8X6_9GAMM|nr:TatD family hydrolase [Aquirhabdus parva]AXI03735.1 TatD family deoxyribonuclease [Aquirhabdus parva]